MITTTLNTVFGQFTYSLFASSVLNVECNANTFSTKSPHLIVQPWLNTARKWLLYENALIKILFYERIIRKGSRFSSKFEAQFFSFIYLFDQKQKNMGICDLFLQKKNIDVKPENHVLLFNWMQMTIKKISKLYLLRIIGSCIEMNKHNKMSNMEESNHFDSNCVLRARW